MVCHFCPFFFQRVNFTLYLLFLTCNQIDTAESACLNCHDICLLLIIATHRWLIAAAFFYDNVIVQRVVKFNHPQHHPALSREKPIYFYVYALGRCSNMLSHYTAHIRVWKCTTRGIRTRQTQSDKYHIFVSSHSWKHYDLIRYINAR